MFFLRKYVAVFFVIMAIGIPFNMAFAEIEKARDAFFKENYKASFEEFHRLSSFGHPRATYWVGVHYNDGLGVEKDKEKAVEWFELAVSRNSALGMLALGGMYLKGDTVEQSLPRGVTLYKQAAKTGSPIAIYALSSLYANGIGVEFDIKETVRLLTLAAEKGHGKARFYLAKSYEDGNGVEIDLNKARYWYERALSVEYEAAREALQNLNEREKKSRQKL